MGPYNVNPCHIKAKPETLDPPGLYLRISLNLYAMLGLIRKYSANSVGCIINIRGTTIYTRSGTINKFPISKN